jgi:phospholipid/cholesterol/gamma-HCH transport system ATP-binding protein
MPETDGIDRGHDSPVIEVDGLEAGYDDVVVIRNVSFEVRRGEVLAVIGKSGCGKTTVLRNIVGLEAPRRGRITIEGVDLGGASKEEVSRMRDRMGMLFQTGALLQSLTVGENIALPLLRYGIQRDLTDRIVRAKLSMVELPDTVDLYPSELSGGMQNRAALARAIALDPAVLLLDEPTSGLDPVTAAEIDRLIKRINRSMRMTTVMISQDLESTLNIADRVIVLDPDEKGIIAEGDPRELKEHSQDLRIVSLFNRLPANARNGGKNGAE